MPTLSPISVLDLPATPFPTADDYRAHPLGGAVTAFEGLCQWLWGFANGRGVSVVGPPAGPYDAQLLAFDEAEQPHWRCVARPELRGLTRAEVLDLVADAEGVGDVTALQALRGVRATRPIRWRHDSWYDSRYDSQYDPRPGSHQSTIC